MVRIPLDIADNVAERAVNIRAKEALVFAYFQSKEFKASEFEAKAGEISKAYDAAHPESFWKTNNLKPTMQRSLYLRGGYFDWRHAQIPDPASAQVVCIKFRYPYNSISI